MYDNALIILHTKIMKSCASLSRNSLNIKGKQTVTSTSNQKKNQNKNHNSPVTVMYEGENSSQSLPLL